MNKFDKVRLIANDEMMEEIHMKNKDINKNLRNFDSTITEELFGANFSDEEKPERVFVLNGTFVIPESYLKKA